MHFVGWSAEKLARAQLWQQVFLIVAGALALALAIVAYVFRTPLASTATAMPTVNGPAMRELQLHGVAAATMLAAYVLVTPPGAVPDEEAYLAKIVRISQGVALGIPGRRPCPIHG